jgi:hypothetical protein
VKDGGSFCLWEYRRIIYAKIWLKEIKAVSSSDIERCQVTNPLLNNPIIITVLASAIGLSIIVTLLLYVVAFFQGREISFYPPKIGPKVDKDSKKRDASNINNPNSIFKTRVQLPDFAKLLDKHSEIWITGKDLYGLTDRHKSKFLAAMHEKKHYRFLIVNPNETHLMQTLTASSTTHPTIKKRMGVARLAIQGLKDIYRENPSNVEIRLANFLPTCSYVILDGKQSSGEMLIEFYGYKISASERLNIHLKRVEDEATFEFHLKQFEEMWRCPDNQSLTS